VEETEGLKMSTGEPEKLEVLQLRLLGVSTENELHLIEKNLLRMEGVNEVRSNLHKRSVTVKYDAGRIVVEALIERIEDMEYGALKIPSTNTRDVYKKTKNCTTCLNILLDSIKDVESIVELNINLETKGIIVRFKPSRSFLEKTK